MVNDIERSNASNSWWGIGLRPFLSKKGFKAAVRDIVNLVREGVHTYDPKNFVESAFFGIWNIARRIVKKEPFHIQEPNVYVDKFQQADVHTDMSKLDLGKYKDFTELNKHVQIATYASASTRDMNKIISEYDLTRIHPDEPDEDVQNIIDALPPNLKEAIESQPHKGFVSDPYTGLHAGFLLDKEDDTLHVVFGGTGQGLDERNFIGKTLMGWEQDASNLVAVNPLGLHIPASYRQAASIVGAFKEIAESLHLKVHVSGFSKGGGEASFAAISNEVRCLSHCGTPLSPACQREFGQPWLQHVVHNDLIFNTTVEGCFVSGLTGLKKVGLVWEKLTTMQMPRRIGKGLHLRGTDINIGVSKKKPPVKWSKLNMFRAHAYSASLFQKVEKQWDLIDDPAETDLAAGRTTRRRENEIVDDTDAQDLNFDADWDVQSPGLPGMKSPDLEID